MVSRRGEFRLTALPEGRTRLEGSTFYTLAIYPEMYWVGWSEALLHAIHHRVLSHIKALSVLADCGCELSVKEVSEELGLSLPGGSRTVDALLRR